MRHPKMRVEEAAPVSGYSVVVQGVVKMVDEDLFKCLECIRANPKALLYRNSDQVLLASTNSNFIPRNPRPTF